MCDGYPACPPPAPCALDWMKGVKWESRGGLPLDEHEPVGKCPVVCWESPRAAARCAGTTTHTCDRKNAHKARKWG